MMQGQWARWGLGLGALALALQACQASAPAAPRRSPPGALATGGTPAGDAPTPPMASASPPQGGEGQPVAPRRIAEGVLRQLVGSVRLVAQGGGLLSDHGGAIIANNGSGLVATAQGGIIGKTKFFRSLLQAPLAEARLAEATVQLLDASGRPLQDAQGQPLQAQSDAQGGFRLSATLPDEHLLLRVVLHPSVSPGGGELLAIAPLKGGQGPLSVDLSTASSLVATHLLDEVLPGPKDQIQVLPGEELEALVRLTESARGALPVAANPYQRGSLAQGLKALLTQAPALAAQEARVRAILLAGQAQLGEGLPAVTVPLTGPVAALPRPDGSVWLVERIGRLRLLGQDGRLRTVLDGQDGRLGILSSAALVANGDAVLLDTSTPALHRVDASGSLSRLWPSGQAGAPSMHATAHVAEDGAGGLWVADRGGNAGQPRLLRWQPVGGVAELPWPAGGPAGLVVALSGETGGFVALARDDAAGQAGPGALWRWRPEGWTKLLAVGSLRSREALLQENGSFWWSEGSVLRTWSGQGSPSDVGGQVPRPDPGPDGAQAAQAGWIRPLQVARRGGSLVVTDADGALVRTVAPDGRLGTLAGATGWRRVGEAEALAVNSPLGLALDPRGQLAFSEAAAGVVRGLSGRTALPIVGRGAPVAAALDNPGALAFDGEALLVVERGAGLIWRLDPSGRFEQVAGLRGGGAMPAQADSALSVGFGRIEAMAVDGQGRVWVSDAGRRVVGRFDRQGRWAVVAGQVNQAGDAGDDQPATGALLDSPAGLAALPDGSVLVADTARFRVRRIRPDGRIEAFAGLGREATIGAWLSGADGPLGPAKQAPLRLPFGLAQDGAGRVFIGELGTRRMALLGGFFSFPGGALPPRSARILQVDAQGQASVFWEAPEDPSQPALVLPSQLLWDPQGRLVVADPGGNQIVGLTRP